MRISSRGRYALKMMLDIALNGGADTPVSLSSVAGRTGLSHGYLEQLAMSLRSARLVRGVAGRHGGYKLVDRPSKITVRMIIEAVMGPVCVVDCIDDPASCPHVASCECFDVYELLNRRITEVLDEFTLEELMHRSALKRRGLGGVDGVTELAIFPNR
ncbi:MAG: Rrf2 family transcriptional regulator [Thermoanaerobaculales bacterium]|jgi:Rrf2 family protein|nr:Rrf2 family transcriptional regulator [Thermoanaerobaculales bacterium]